MNEYWIVTENKTGRVICHCGHINDALMMYFFDPYNRSYSKHRYLMDQVIDVTSTTDKQLPTTDIVVNGAVGSDWKLEPPTGANGPGEPLPQIKLPQSQGEPVIV